LQGRVGAVNVDPELRGRTAFMSGWIEVNGGRRARLFLYKLVVVVVVVIVGKGSLDIVFNVAEQL